VLAACALAWVIGRVLSDRYAWSQPISWVPTPMVLVPVWAGLGAGLWQERRKRMRAKRHGTSTRVRSLRPVFWLAAMGLFALISAGHFVFVELGLHRAVLSRGGASTSQSAPGDEAAPLMRLVFWNQAGQEAGDISQTFLELDPAFLVLANRHSRTRTRDLAQAFLDTGPAQAAVGWPFDLFSRYPIERWASTSLGLDGKSRPNEGIKHNDPGWAAWYQVRTPQGLLVIWAIDLPSDPEAPRMALVQEAGEAIRTWQGRVRVRHGNERRTEHSTTIGFPPPDIIVGDFNIPRHSASISELLRASGAGTMHNAFDLGGSGWQRTWPRKRSIWAIDQCFVSPRLSMRTHTTFDPGVGGHRAIVIEFD